jgi:hypothetical protein
MQSAIRFFVWRQEKWRSGDRLASQFFEKTRNSLELTMHPAGKGSKFPGTNGDQGSALTPSQREREPWSTADCLKTACVTNTKSSLLLDF